MIFGLLNLSLKGYVITTLVLTQITIACVTLYLHRCQTHQAIKLHPIMSHFFRFWLWLTTGIVTKEWVSIHRKHHAKCETPDDPHSPVNWGLKTMLLKGAIVYRTGKTKETIETYGHGTPNDWIERYLYSKHEKLGILSMLVINLVFLGLPGLMVWLIQMAWVPFWAAGVINGVGHFYGYRNFETKDASTNIMPLAIFVGGEELHNNHHTFPSSAKLSVKWWEVDIGWLYICVLRFFRLAEVKRTVSLISQEKTNSVIDRAIVKTIVNNRLQVMADYCQRVIVPALKIECRNSIIKNQMLSNDVKKLLTCSDYFINDEKRKMIEKILENSVAIKQVYQFKLSLQKLWESKASSEELVFFFRDWVTDAKYSGNIWLEKFATTLPHYTVTKKSAIINA